MQRNLKQDVSFAISQTQSNPKDISSFFDKSVKQKTRLNYDSRLVFNLPPFLKINGKLKWMI